ncbi:MAG: hypothetical protein MZW92_45235 [Comamonadaceae bacterium]|nr:hypothetical protein [Comamonadaceae bacterium]
MGDYSGFIEGLLIRLAGPMGFRFLIQPLMAIFFAIRDGRKDEQEGRAPYFWALFSEPEHRRDMLKSGWKSVGKVFIIAIILDIVFQFIVFHGLRPGAGVIAGVILAIIPYILLRGPVNRVVQFIRKGKGSHEKQDQ